ncbi:DNA polymerase III subunit beta [Schlegelella sp. S2-27]|uniref:DNA polymerase III subunit beta n=1 Tax=Caldimonas mangrovi TaxID=2944811 RepID=A0ABT0YTU1_9BURK|nr:DNA polymerase III subunit beta [Caldimonas mangrovi]MCM5682178.1 DNA polymerase III subunit beta [Caldimonas mangrovi]
MNLRLGKQETLATLCRENHVLRLDVPESDPKGAAEQWVFVVEFEDLVPPAFARAYFALSHALEALLDRPVYLLTEAAVRNPYLRAQVEKQRRRLS